jgi:hypothetical protein
MVLLILALAAASMPVSAAEDKAPPDEKLIEQLGSSDFAQRERAARMLQARGPAALPALRKAKTHRDAEVRRRVLAMIPILETAAALAPKRVTLGREPRTLSAILQEIEKQTGYRIDRDDKEDGRLFRIEMKGASFWEAMERIGRETSRVVDTAPDKDGLRLNPRKARSPFVALNGPFRLELGTIHEERDIDFTRPGKGKETGQGSRRQTMAILILAEPRFILLDAGQASVQIATDEEGKALRLPTPDKQPRSTHTFSPFIHKDFKGTSEILLGGNSDTARKIEVLRGTIPVQMVVERKRIVLTENVLKGKRAKCRVRKGPLEITKVEQGDDGDLYIHLTVPVESESIRRQWLDRIHLEDAKGHLFKTGGRGIEGIGRQTEQIFLTFSASKDPKICPPSKLIVEDWATLDYAIPFEFKDVPLP